MSGVAWRAVLTVLALLAAAVVGLATGCGAAPRGGTNAPARAAALRYERALTAAQARLAAAERAVPATPGSAAGLAAAVRRLAGAVGTFHDDLLRITPPAVIRDEHGRLVAVAAALRRDLLGVASDAVRPGRLATAGSRLVATTVAAGQAFDATVATIRRRLGR